MLLGSGQGADDLVAEAFAKVLKRLAAGGGPDSAFRSYLMTTIRTTLYKQLAADRMVDRQVELSQLSLPMWHPDPVVDKLETELAVRALRSLPERWQRVLRLLEVEGNTTATVGQRLGLRANAVSALAFRARDALRLAYLQMHVNGAVPERCRETTTNLAAWLCGRLTRSLRLRVYQHLQDCQRCARAADELTDLLAQMRRTVPLAVADPPVPPAPRSAEATPQAVPTGGGSHDH
jgi:RNA polymerase sigma factor (sigma-70 family)